MALDTRNPETEDCAEARLADELEEIAEHCANLSVLDRRDSGEILGYDDIGIPR